MTEDEKLRLACLEIAAKHYFPRSVGFGMPDDAEIVRIVSNLADSYLHYVKTGSQSTSI